MFVDDIIFWCSGSDLIEMETTLNNALSALSVIASETELCFTSSNFSVTFFTTNKRLYNHQPKLKMDNQDLVYEKHPKYLGYILDPEWTSNKHIGHIVSISIHRLKILKYIAGKG
ncbi:reverse transcriptase domain-containing protein [Trichonephila clavipes]|nr:reverse transcriptase domain-containing protein [Trichonephila clavipes]